MLDLAKAAISMLGNDTTLYVVFALNPAPAFRTRPGAALLHSTTPPPVPDKSPTHIPVSPQTLSHIPGPCPPAASDPADALIRVLLHHLTLHTSNSTLRQQRLLPPSGHLEVSTPLHHDQDPLAKCYALHAADPTTARPAVLDQA